MMTAPQTSQRATVGGRKRGQGSKWCAKDKRLALYLRDGCSCAYCGRTVALGIDATLDHVLACELGGTNEPKNLVTACLSCNSQKRDLTLRRWFAFLRSNGTDTAKLGARIRRNTRKNLAKYRRQAKMLISLHGYGGACTIINETQA